MKKEWHHYLLGLFIAEQLKRAGVNINSMCKETHMGPATYELIKGASISC